ncbi:hypothetical protein HWC35_gp184 [Vibrio phage USC-1]|uniref:Uncharacterized protein n=2 Tax=Aphroditevirus USC1 TaxID=2846605 RepID=A0A514A2R3_9CAUD|nr:hypothetical protein HWC35_gp184 [Vibrio phage USC-1]QCW23149.1 hypothetical protein [Vibrio phage 5 TSL-2019]QDH47578.1 hypothetical protein [Vibrio phage USC-1]
MYITIAVITLLFVAWVVYSYHNSIDPYEYGSSILGNRVSFTFKTKQGDHRIILKLSQHDEEHRYDGDTLVVSRSVADTEYLRRSLTTKDIRESGPAGEFLYKIMTDNLEGEDFMFRHASSMRKLRKYVLSNFMTLQLRHLYTKEAVW